MISEYLVKRERSGHWLSCGGSKLRAAKLSTSGRVIWYCLARFSAVSPMLALAAMNASHLNPGSTTRTSRSAIA